jgi:hypothetical protein
MGYAATMAPQNVSPRNQGTGRTPCGGIPIYIVQGSFDSDGDSLRESPSALRMTL